MCVCVWIILRITSISCKSKLKQLTPKAGLTVPCSISPNSTVFSVERCILAKQRESGVRFPLGAELDRRKDERSSEICSPVSPPSRQGNKVVGAAQLFCNHLLGLETSLLPERKKSSFIYCLTVMCSHRSVTVVDPVRGDRHICHMNLWFVTLSDSWKFVSGSATVRIHLVTTSLKTPTNLIKSCCFNVSKCRQRQFLLGIMIILSDALKIKCSHHRRSLIFGWCGKNPQKWESKHSLCFDSKRVGVCALLSGFKMNSLPDCFPMIQNNVLQRSLVGNAPKAICSNPGGIKHTASTQVCSDPPDHSFFFKEKEKRVLLLNLID